MNKPQLTIKQQLAKLQNISLNTTHSARNLDFITFSDQISSLSKSCYYHICQLRCMHPCLDFKTANAIATSIVHSKLDYCNSLYFNLPKTQLNRLQNIQNSLARAVANTPIVLAKLQNISLNTIHSARILAILTHHPFLKSLHWLKIEQRIQYKLISLTYRILTTSQPTYLHNLISLQTDNNTRSSDVVTLARPSPSSSLEVTDRSFQYASPHLWNKLPFSLREPVSPLYAYLNPSFSSPLSPSITPLLFHSKLKTYLFVKSFPP